MEDMKKKNQKKQIIRVLSESVQKIIEQERMDFSELQEIRLRIGQPVTVLYQNEELILPTMYSEKKRLGKQEMKETIEHISNYSLYAYEHELKQGFITIEGGHRVGMAGQVIMEGLIFEYHMRFWTAQTRYFPILHIINRCIIH